MRHEGGRNVRKKKPCEYCKEWTTYDDRNYLHEDEYLSVFIDHMKNSLTIIYGSNDIDEDIEISYCPMCGRKLEDSIDDKAQLMLNL